MPVYLRKNVNYTPASIDNIPQEDDDDFVTDPDQLKDNLPQPYRMIDKVLNSVFEVAWEIIEERENARIEEAKKVKIPQYECTIEIETYGGATSIVDSGDEKYIFIGLPNGITVLNADNHTRVFFWEEDKVEVTYIKAHKITENKYLVISIDDLGFARLHGFAQEKLFLLRILNEQQDGGQGTKMLVHKCEASEEGDYLGSLFENPSSGQIWLEISKLPKETWITELDNKLAEIQKELEKKDGLKEKVEETPAPPAEEGEEPVQQDSYAEVLQTDKGMKFTPPTLVLKLKPPPPVSAIRNRGNLAPSIHQATQKVDSGDVVGTGQNHILTTNNLETRQEVFNHLHDSLLEYLPDTNLDPNVVPSVNFHFLCPGRLPNIPQDTNQANNPTSVAVWWKNTTHVMHYSLSKPPPKDGEIKPDLVWPYTSKVTASVTTPDTSLMVIGLQNGNIVVWNRYLGIQQGVINITDSASIDRMWFLDPCICPQDDGMYPPYLTKTIMYILIKCSDESMYIYTHGQGISEDPQCVVPPCESDNEKFGRIQPILGLPDLMLTVEQSGTIQVRETLQGRVLCECRLPATHELTCPWDPIIAVGAMGRMLYVRGSMKEETKTPEEVEEGEEIVVKTEIPMKSIPGKLFVFALRSFPTLDTYNEKQWPKVPYKVHTTSDERVKALMTERILQQGLRKTRMQERWGLLRDEIYSILQYKEQALKKAEHRPVYNFKPVFHYEKTPGSVGWAPLFQ